MTKQIQKILQGILLVLLTLALSACVTINDEPDDPTEDPTGELSTPKYDADAALFTITDDGADLMSIELTESGHYIVIPAGYMSGQTLSRGESSEPSFGTYSRKGEGQYMLDGLGSLKISEHVQTAVVVTLARLSGVEVSYRARRETPTLSPTTSLLCRSWAPCKVRMRRYIDDELVAQRELAFNQYLDMYDGSDKYPEYVIFTRSGSYYGVFSNKGIAISKWSWETEETGLLKLHNLYDESENSLIQVSFDGAYMLWTATVSGPYQGYEYSSDSIETIETTIFLEEVKD